VVLFPAQGFEHFPAAEAPNFQRSVNFENRRNLQPVVGHTGVNADRGTQFYRCDELRGPLVGVGGEGAVSESTARGVGEPFMICWLGWRPSPILISVWFFPDSESSKLRALYPPCPGTLCAWYIARPSSST